MGFRFRKSVGIVPGLKLNLSKTGPSLTFGGKGFTLNVGKSGTRTTLGVPGTGMSYSTTESVGGMRKSGLGKNLLIFCAMAALAVILYQLRG